MNIAERMKHFNIAGLSVTHFADGKIERSEHFGLLQNGLDKTVDGNSIFHACSMSKMVTAICVLRLAQDGRLDLHRDVNEYLTARKLLYGEFDGGKKVTLANLLAHQAGLRGNDHDLRYEPETDCEYSDVGYCIISQVIFDATGENVQQLAKRFIFEPLGLIRTFFWDDTQDKNAFLADCAAGHDKHGSVVKGLRAVYANIAAAGLWTTTNELASLIIDLLKSYHDGGGLMLNQEMTQLMLTPYGCTDDVGLGVFLFPDSENKGKSYFVSQGWGVGMQCKLHVYYESQNGVIVMTNTDTGKNQNDSLIGEIIRHVCNELTI